MLYHEDNIRNLELLIEWYLVCLWANSKLQTLYCLWVMSLIIFFIDDNLFITKFNKYNTRCHVILRKKENELIKERRRRRRRSFVCCGMSWSRDLLCWWSKVIPEHGSRSKVNYYSHLSILFIALFIDIKTLGLDYTMAYMVNEVVIISAHFNYL